MNPEIEKINKQISRLTEKRNKLRDACEHLNHKAERGANTGHWDKSDDCWWVDVTCHDCGSYFHFDSDKDKENYRKYCYPKTYNDPLSGLSEKGKALLKGRVVNPRKRATGKILDLERQPGIKKKSTGKKM